MSYHTLIVGGGLSGLTCGIALARHGKRVAIVNAAPSSLTLSGGSMELLGNVDGKMVTNPLDALDRLSDGHPYRRIGLDNIEPLARQAKQLLTSAGIATVGDVTRNHFRITPMGVLKPAWLTLDGMATASDAHQLPWPHVTIIDIRGFVDYPLDFVVDGLQRLGTQVDVKQVAIDRLRTARNSSTEMRASSIARSLPSRAAITQLANAINAVTTPDDVLLLPAVIGLEDDYARQQLRQQVKAQLFSLATLPPSVPGQRIAFAMRLYYQMLGGAYLAGDTVTTANFDGSHVVNMIATKRPDVPLYAENYVLATGSFIGRGLVADSNTVVEPIAGLDIALPEHRDQWSDYGMMGDQPYMSMGVAVDGNFHGIKDGSPVDNLYAIGALLGGHNPLVLGDSHGVDMLTALQVAKQLL